MQANFADIYLWGMRDRSMRSGTELAREIQLTDWSTAGEQGKLRFLSRKNVEKKFLWTNKIFFRSLNQIRRLRVARKPP